MCERKTAEYQFLFEMEICLFITSGLDIGCGPGDEGEKEKMAIKERLNGHRITMNFWSDSLLKNRLLILIAVPRFRQHIGNSLHFD